MFPRLPLQNAGTQVDDDLPSADTTSTPSYQISESADWWANAIEDDTFFSPMPFDASESGLWNGRFVPPPPRPPFLENSVHSDGLTTCDLCSWAWHDKNSFSTLGDTIGELSKNF